MIALVLYCLFITSLSAAGAAPSTNDLNQLYYTTEIEISLFKDRLLQLEPEIKCGVTGFTVYNPTTGNYDYMSRNQWFNPPKARILLDKYTHGRINIIASIDESECAKNTIKCVTMSLGNDYVINVNKAPFSLYGSKFNGTIKYRRPTQTGYNKLVATSFSSADCTGTIINKMTTDLQLVPKTTQTIIPLPIKATYVGTESKGVTVHPRETKEIVKVTCNFLKDAIDNGFVYKSSISFNATSFKCRKVNSNINTKNIPLFITYQVIGTFTIGADVSFYLNPDMPTSEELTDYIGKLFLNKIKIAPGADFGMWDTLVDDLHPSNSYHNFTKIIIG